MTRTDLIYPRKTTPETTNNHTSSSYYGSYQLAANGGIVEEEEKEQKVAAHPNGGEHAPLVRKSRPLAPPNDEGVAVLLGWILVLVLVLVIPLALRTLGGDTTSNNTNTNTNTWVFSSARDASSFDYIVVGGGPSGIICATKLARAFPDLIILLLESGTSSQASVLRTVAGTTTNNYNTNTGADFFLGGDGIDNTLNKFDVPLLWSGLASSQGRRRALPPKTTNGEKGQALWSNHHWPIKKTLIGRALGGSGVHNAMIYVRALPTDFVRWNMTDLWSFRDILPHYVALESFQSINRPASFWPNDSAADTTEDIMANQRKPWRGYDGPVRTIADGMALDAIAPLFIQSALANGQRLAAEGFNVPDAASRVGVGYYEFNIREGVRDSIAHAFITNDQKPENLHIVTGVTITKVLVDGRETPNRPFGVEYIVERTGAIQRSLLTDTRVAEVILAAGALLTPQILANSGIAHGGSVLDLKGVGANLQDHPVVGMAFELRPELALEASSIYTIGDEMEDYLVTVAELQHIGHSLSNLTQAVRFNLNERLGTLGTAGFSAGGFLRSPWADDEGPDIQLTVFPRQIEPHTLHSETYEEVSRLRSRVMLVTVALLYPEARYQVYPFVDDASLTEKSSSSSRFEARVDRDSPFAQMLGYRLPSIGLPSEVTRYLSERDAKRIAWGVEQVRSIQRTPPLSQNTGDEVYPGANVTKEKLVDYIHEKSMFNSHWVGSTKMGPASDPLAVVDERLSVHGMPGLRIVDAGVIPVVPNGNTHSTVCVVASRAADLIAEDRRRASVAADKLWH
jgi:choline dehydrogenase